MPANPVRGAGASPLPTVTSSLQAAPSAQRRFVGRYRNREAARAKFGPRADWYARWYEVGDPLADAFVAWSVTQPNHLGRRMLDRALTHGIAAVPDAPEVLRELIAYSERVPEWVDFDQINRGARAYQRTGMASGLVLSAYALMNGYRSGAAVKPLVATGQLDKMAPRRLAETGRFVVEQIQEDGLRRWHPGFRMAVQVRVLHALVRRMLLASPHWQLDEWGVPINQADMAGTVLEFSLLMLWGTRMLGFRFSHDESEAVMALWRYSGYLSGVDPELLAYFDSEARATGLAELMDMVQPPADADSVALAQALRKVPSDPAFGGSRLQAWLMTRYHDGLTHAFQGPEVAQALQIPNAAWRLALFPTRVLVGAIETVRTHVPGAEAALVYLGNRELRKTIRRQLGGKEPGFMPVQEIRLARRPA